MSESTCYYYDEQRNRCNCYVNENLDELLAENARLKDLVVEVFNCAKRGAACEMCKVNNDGYVCVYIMQELGIEV